MEVQGLSREVTFLRHEEREQAQKAQHLEVGSHVKPLAPSAPLLVGNDMSDLEDIEGEKDVSTFLLDARDSALKHEAQRQFLHDATSERIQEVSPVHHQNASMQRGKSTFLHSSERNNNEDYDRKNSIKVPQQEEDAGTNKMAGADEELTELDRYETSRTIESYQADVEGACMPASLPFLRLSTLAQASLVDQEEPLAIVISTAQQNDGGDEKQSTQKRYRTWIGLWAACLLLVIIAVTVTAVVLTSSSRGGEDDAVDSPLEQPTTNTPPSLAPTSSRTIFDIMMTEPELEIVGAAELSRANYTLSDTSRTLTMFAADINAFFDESLDSFLAVYSPDEWRGHTQSLIKQHIVEGTPTLEHGMELETLAGGTLQVTVDNGIIHVNNVAIEE
jgi:uncharacterized surface protein with fasciclin (FAS1) repeats